MHDREAPDIRFCRSPNVQIAGSRAAGGAVGTGSETATDQYRVLRAFEGS
jgi:hypothetical protein